jgi:thiol-disulfide isomerase/thioredoxin
MNPAGPPYKIMKKICFILIVFLMGSIPALSAEPNQAALENKFKTLGIIPLPGILPPRDDGLTDMTGNPVRLSDFKGKIVFLNFWTTWCPDCRHEIPDIETLKNKFKRNEDDFIVLAVDLREPQANVKKFIRRNKYTFTILLDKSGRMGRSFAIRAIPITYILGRDGRLLGKAMGPRNWDNKKFLNLFEFLIGDD